MSLTVIIFMQETAIFTDETLDFALVDPYIEEVIEALEVDEEEKELVYSDMAALSNEVINIISHNIT